MEIEERIKDVISEQLGVAKDDIKLTDKIDQELGADSLDIMELVMSLEEELAVEIDDEEIKPNTTVENIIEYISEREAVCY